jgi:glycosyltransferase involved in cell wall biosynthesis
MLDVLLIQIGEPLPIEKYVRKMRTAILSDKLLEKGHNVLWLTSAFDHFKKKWIFDEDKELSIKKGFKIKAIKGKGYKKNISISRYIDHRIIARKFRKLAPKMKKPDIIIASMPPHDLAYESIRFAKENYIPVLVDIRDQWPDIFFSFIPPKLQNLAKIPFYRDFYTIKKVMQKADGLVAVSKTFLEWGLNYAEREEGWKDKVFYLGYKKYKVLNNSRPMKKFRDLMDVLKKKFIFFFVGTISKSYHNPFILLKAAEKLSEYDNIHLVISGDGELYEELKKRSQGLHNVSLTGWLNQKEIEFLLENSNIGICPSTKIVNLPSNKIFAYLSAGLPVISSFHGDIKEIIEKHQIGYYYPPQDVDTLVDCIKRLYEDINLYKKTSENAQMIFDEMFDADKIYEEYIKYIEKIVDDFRKKEKIKPTHTKVGFLSNCEKLLQKLTFK